MFKHDTWLAYRFFPFPCTCNCEYTCVNPYKKFNQTRLFIPYFSGTSTSGNPWKRFCGRDTEVVVSTTNTLTLEFTSDGSIEYGGFLLNYTIGKSEIVLFCMSITPCSNIDANIIKKM